jgi:hypothetical protein
MKVLDQQTSSHSFAPAIDRSGEQLSNLILRLNDPTIHLRTDGAEVLADSAQLQMQFPSGTGYVERIVTLSW